MRCFSCHKLSFSTFCKKCQTNLLQPSISKRTFGSLEVYSFFKYQNIEDLLLTKHTPQGFKLYKALAELSFKPFIKNFMKEDSSIIYVVGIDENVKSGYAHVALLTHEMKTKNVKVEHAKLMAKNKNTYSGKTLQFRLKNPRDFIYTGKKGVEVILVDDIVTTGTTLQEATRTLKQNGVEVLFALTLASVTWE
ncbi:MAG: Possible purine/pyrimidine phosphoribosyltransferase [uncultured Sulfurovum sp.]|uniref:Possible purine/pyrimidine phosphoribosyltransferase n=1 Tax=uncultured Sulfurovum sp. TaxID=269237 RepID=A0A6S6THV8_9BACT|nr:MAG: Possible purine/pyrimidine phosphoribosyltransferase [uncultured Sulfurovum sp.]